MVRHRRADDGAVFGQAPSRPSSRPLHAIGPTTHPPDVARGAKLLCRMPVYRSARSAESFGDMNTLPTELPSTADPYPSPDALLEEVRAALGFVPNLVRLWAEAPHLVSTLVSLETTIGGPGLVPQRLKELAMTRTSELNGCPYCKSFHHARLRTLGFPQHLRTQLGSPELPLELFDERERCVLRLAEEMTLDVRASPATLEECRNLFGRAGAVELMAAVALLNFDNRMAYSAQLEPDEATLEPTP